ncbi:glycosyltransferase [Lentisphaerota bacterium WC36G]|nr:hypothetical protein LJT99_08645 [Lentisphaerae bacterium WC36]
MQSLIHCIWTGPSFPYRLRVFIKVWSRYLVKCNSDFKLVVWMTADSYRAASDFLSIGVGNVIDQKAWHNGGAGLDVLVNIAQVNFCKFHIAMAEPLFAEYDNNLQRAFGLFSSHRYYTSVSNIFRVLVVNKFGGIYTDVDYLMPNEKVMFPKNINEILRIFCFSSSIEFYMPVVDLIHRKLAENQCLILSPQCVGKLNPLITEMCGEIEKRYADIYHEADVNLEFLDNKVTQALIREMFTSYEMEKILKAYATRNYQVYCDLIDELYRGETQCSKDIFRRSPVVDVNGTRHSYYRNISYCTYKIVGSFFVKKLHTNLKNYYEQCWIAFKGLFEEGTLDKQFLFRGKRGHPKGMYNWANPGYARLSNLENAVRVVERRAKYIQKPRIKVALAKRLVQCVEVQFLRTYSIRPQEHGGAPNEAMSSFTALKSVVENGYFKKRFSMSMEDSLNFLKIFVLGLQNISTQQYDLIVILTSRINESHFLEFRKLIDPQKDQLDVDDIRAFIRQI